jgi:hypothetical protein
METVLMSVAKDRKGQRRQTAFVDALLHSNLTDRQVLHRFLDYKENRLIGAEHRASCCCYSRVEENKTSFLLLF